MLVRFVGGVCIAMLGFTVNLTQTTAVTTAVMLGSLVSCGLESTLAQSDVELWAGAPIQLKPSSGPESTLYQTVFSPSDRLLATRDSEQVIRVWDLATGLERYAIGRHVDRISTIAFSPDERFLASASTSQDGSIHVWNAADGKLLRRIFEADHPVSFS